MIYDASMDALMEKARDMVTIAEKISSAIQASTSEAGSEEDQEFHAMLHNLGIPSPVTKESAGAAYHKELSRQLSDFLVPYLKQKGEAVIMLIDL